MKLIIKALAEHLYFSCRQLPQKHLTARLHKIPPAVSYAARGILFSVQSSSMQAKADSNGIIHLGHLFFVQATHMLPQTAFVNGTDLLKQDHGIL